MKTTFPVLAILSVLLAAPAAAQQQTLFQELGGFAVVMSSDHPELPDPKGFGLASVWEFGGAFMARLSFHRASDDTRKEGIVCDQYSQRINCRPEATETSVSLSGLRGTVMVRVPVGDLVRLGAGGGLSFNHISAESVGTVSNLEADLLAPNAGIIGFNTLLSATITPVASIPLQFTGGFGIHWVDFNTCSGNDPPQYDPFCGMEPFREIELGLSFSF
jgi:hypothetical protein